MVTHAPGKSQDRPPKKARIAAPKRDSRPKDTSRSKLSTKISTQQPKPVAPSAKGKEKAINVPVETKTKSKTKSKKTEEEYQLPTSFKVIAGSYEKLLYGLEGTVAFEDSKLQFRLKPTFIFPAHVSCIKAVAASPHGGKWLATGSADEIIKVWDLRRRKEIGGLMHHEGSITHLLFPSRSHLLSASEDGTLCLFRARDWVVLRSLKGHKGRVNAVAVHPSGKVALSVGKDRALRMWDLMRGKGVASTKLGKEGEVVRFSTDGSKFAVQSGSTLEIYATNMDLLCTITHGSRIHDIKFCGRVGGEGEVLLVGAEDHKVSVYDIPKDGSAPKIMAEMIGHTNRVKAIQTLEIALPESSGRKSTTIACTVSSDGFINVYDTASIPEVTNASTTEIMKIEPLVNYDTKGTRLTCVTLADDAFENIAAAGDAKRKRDEDDGSEHDESGDEDEAEWEREGEGEDEEEEEGEEEEDEEESE
ncbi:WD40 repeat-like protein [Pholiota conissans]|uniref:WD40 repeat-like protein n=1 Tax=Pholiota conissans TaxID=109636 RepID=A0A9P5YP96_9AGAR|nr:WD40 repeat-like protein [Pholiota conissans]